MVRMTQDYILPGGRLSRGQQGRREGRQDREDVNGLGPVTRRPVDIAIVHMNQPPVNPIFGPRLQVAAQGATHSTFLVSSAFG